MEKYIKTNNHVNMCKPERPLLPNHPSSSLYLVNNLPLSRCLNKVIFQSWMFTICNFPCWCTLCP